MRARAPTGTVRSIRSRVRTARARSTSRLIDSPEGTQQLVVEAQDAAGNRRSRHAVVARIDNTPPARVDVALEGGDGWRNQKRLGGGLGQPRRGRPGADRRGELRVVRRGDANSCSRGTSARPDVSRLPLTVPGPGSGRCRSGERTPQATSEADNASVPVTLRYDPEPPQLAFEPPAAGRPDARRRARDRRSCRESPAARSRSAPPVPGLWQTLPTQTGWRPARRAHRRCAASGRARTCSGRARSDQAGNEASTGSPRATASRWSSRFRCGRRRRFDAGFERTVRRPGNGAERDRAASSGARGIRSSVRRSLAASTTDDGRAIAGAPVQCCPQRRGAEQLVDTLTTDADGRFRTVAIGTQQPHAPARVRRLVADAAQRRRRSSCACRPRPRRG